MPFGWGGTILRVDLSKKKIVKTSTVEYSRDYLGGRGINSKMLYDETKPGMDPFDPQSRYIIGVGPLVGIFPGASRLTVTAKSPLTGIHGDANAGGDWAAELKLAGYDNIVFFGKSDQPVYLWIQDDYVELRDAKDLWGKTTSTTGDIIKEELRDPEIKVLSIGPAGENLVRFANTVAGYGREAGRTGTGAVAGSKKLKAVAVKGTKGVKTANPQKLREFLDEYLPELQEKIKKDVIWPMWSTHGTIIYIELNNEIGTLSIKNNQLTQIEDILPLSVETFKKYMPKKYACFGCPLHCSHYFHVEEGPYSTSGAGVEYEGVAALGTKLLNLNYPAVLKANALCNELGMDVVSAGHAIAVVMECFQRGLIDEKFTDGVQFEWGDSNLIINALEKIAYRVSYGNILAEGSLRVAKKIGKDAEKYVLQCKGLESPDGDHRGRKGCALAYCVSTRGYDHLRGVPQVEVYGITVEEANKYYGIEELSNRLAYRGKGMVLVPIQQVATIADCLGMCKFHTQWMTPLGLGLEEMATIFNIVTGLNMTAKDFENIAERVFTTEQCFNIREGILPRRDDVPPWRYMNEPVPSGVNKGELITEEGRNLFLDEYYETHNWDKKTGKPTRARLEQLGLKYIADEHEKLGLLPKPE